MDKKYIRIAVQQSNAYQRRHNYEGVEEFDALTERLYEHWQNGTDFELSASERQGLIEATKQSIEYELGPDADLIHPRTRRKLVGPLQEFLEALEAGE